MSGMQKKRVLVIEDNELNREILSQILSEQYQVLEAENGQVALDILKEYKSGISLIFLDVVMPVMEGYTFLDRLRADSSISFIPVVVTTQSNSEENEVNALSHGATDFVPKPYRPKIIMQRAANLIELPTAPPRDIWCRRPESNRYDVLASQDFKSCASASSATSACI